MLDYIVYLESHIRHPVQLNILDLILINPFTMHAHKWVFTDAEGFIRFHQLKPLPFQDIAKSLLANTSTTTAQLAQHRRIENLRKRYNEVACFTTDGEGVIKYLTVAELWEYQENSPLRLTSVQLFQNPIKRFEPFLYCVQSQLLPLTHYKKRTLSKGGGDEVKINAQEKFWKEKIERVNCKVHPEELPLEESEINYTELMRRDVSKIIKAINHVSKKQVRSIKAMFVIHRKETEPEPWLVGCEDIQLESVKCLKGKPKQCDIGKKVASEKSIQILPKHFRSAQKESDNLVLEYSEIKKKPIVGTRPKFGQLRNARSVSRARGTKLAPLLDVNVPSPLIVKKAGTEALITLENPDVKIRFCENLKQGLELRKHNESREEELIKIKGVGPFVQKVERKNNRNLKAYFKNSYAPNNALSACKPFQVFFTSNPVRTVSKKSGRMPPLVRNKPLYHYGQKVLSDASPYFLCKGEEFGARYRPESSLGAFYEQIRISQKPLERLTKPSKVGFRTASKERKMSASVENCRKIVDIENEYEDLSKPVFNVVVKQGSCKGIFGNSEKEKKRAKLGKCNIYEIDPSVLLNN